MSARLLGWILCGGCLAAGVWVLWQRRSRVSPEPPAQVSVGLSDGSAGEVDAALREELLATAEAVVGDERALARLRARRSARRGAPAPE